MVAIAPFRALRYNPGLVGDLSAVVAPPYDVISPQQQDQLYERSPYNVVRLILGKESPADSPSDNRYTRAKQTFEAWRAAGVLVRDERPALYLCEHAFRWEGHSCRRLGFLARLEFEGSVPDGVLVHEQTFDAPKHDRARLTEAVQAHLSPIFCVAPDPDRKTASFVEQLMQHQPPTATARFDEGQVRLWAVTEADTIETVRQRMAPLRVLVADGHHRFAVALSKRHLCGGVLTYFSWANDPGLLVHPIHRVVRLPSGAQERWRSQLRALCALTPVPSLEPLAQWLASSTQQGRFGYYESGQWHQAQVQEPWLAQWLMHPSVPLALAGLDVSLLHHLVLPTLLRDGTPASLRYTPQPNEALALIQQGEGDCVFLLRPIPLEQVCALAAQGFTLPHKTTYFSPKVPSGLVINPFDPAPASSVR